MADSRSPLSLTDFVKNRFPLTSCDTDKVKNAFYSGLIECCDLDYLKVTIDSVSVLSNDGMKENLLGHFLFTACHLQTQKNTCSYRPMSSLTGIPRINYTLKFKEEQLDEKKKYENIKDFIKIEWPKVIQRILDLFRGKENDKAFVNLLTWKNSQGSAAIHSINIDNLLLEPLFNRIAQLGDDYKHQILSCKNANNANLLLCIISNPQAYQMLHHTFGGLLEKVIDEPNSYNVTFFQNICSAGNKETISIFCPLIKKKGPKNHLLQQKDLGNNPLHLLSINKNASEIFSDVVTVIGNQYGKLMLQKNSESLCNTPLHCVLHNKKTDTGLAKKMLEQLNVADKDALMYVTNNNGCTVLEFALKDSPDETWHLILNAVSPMHLYVLHCDIQRRIANKSLTVTKPNRLEEIQVKIKEVRLHLFPLFTMYDFISRSVHPDNDSLQYRQDFVTCLQARQKGEPLPLLPQEGTTVFKTLANAIGIKTDYAKLRDNLQNIDPASAHFFQTFLASEAKPGHIAQTLLDLLDKPTHASLPSPPSPVPQQQQPVSTLPAPLPYCAAPTHYGHDAGGNLIFFTTLPVLSSQSVAVSPQQQPMYYTTGNPYLHTSPPPAAPTVASILTPTFQPVGPRKNN